MTRPNHEDFEKAQIEIVPLSSTGTAVFLAAVVSGYLLGLPTTEDGCACLAGTVRQDGPRHRGDSLHAGAGLRDQVLGNGRCPWAWLSPGPVRCSIPSSARCWAGWAWP